MVARRGVLRALRRYAGLSSRGRRFVVRAWMGAPLVEGALRWMGLATTLRWIDRLPSSVRPGAPGAIGIAQGSSLVSAVYAWHFVRGACLPRALLQYALHRMDGVPAELRVGVARRDEAGGLAAHAWVDEPGAEPRSDDAAFAPVLMRRSVAA